MEEFLDLDIDPRYDLIIPFARDVLVRIFLVLMTSKLGTRFYKF